MFFYAGCGDNGAGQLNLIELNNYVLPEKINHLRPAYILGDPRETMVGAGGQTTTFLNTKTGSFESFGGKHKPVSDSSFYGIDGDRYLVGGGGYDRRLFGCVSKCSRQFVVKVSDDNDEANSDELV